MRTQSNKEKKRESRWVRKYQHVERSPMHQAECWCWLKGERRTCCLFRQFDTLSVRLEALGRSVGVCRSQWINLNSHRLVYHKNPTRATLNTFYRWFRENEICDRRRIHRIRCKSKKERIVKKLTTEWELDNQKAEERKKNAKSSFNKNRIYILFEVSKWAEKIRTSFE